MAISVTGWPPVEDVLLSRVLNNDPHAGNNDALGNYHASDSY